VLVGHGAGSDGELFLGRVAWLVSGRLVEVRESVAEPVAEVGGAAILFLEDRVFDDGGPDGAVLIVAGFEGTVLLLGEGTALLATRLLKDGRSVWERRANFGGKVGLGVRVVLFVRVREVSAEAASGRGLRDECPNREKSAWRRDTYRSLRSTGERLSKCKVGSFKIAFQLPTPCYVT